MRHPGNTSHYPAKPLLADKLEPAKHYLKKSVGSDSNKDTDSRNHGVIVSNSLSKIYSMVGTETYNKRRRHGHAADIICGNPQHRVASQ